MAESVPAERCGALTTPEPPAETLWGVDRDGSSRYRGHKRRCLHRKQGGTVECMYIALHP